MRYGFYRDEEFRAALGQCRAMIFLCEHETQGIAYQQALSCDVPIFAWDRGGYWQDPSYYPDKVKFAPVTSVPYWDDRCGRKFLDAADFAIKWNGFWNDVEAKHFRAREYILENLTLEMCARQYVEVANNLLN
jgi:glycosyltransferase involved in cell wall biosynthesis